jgi:superkiller protein 3
MRLIAFTFSFLFSLNWAIAQVAEEQNNKAIELMTEEKYEEAQLIFEKLVAENPGSTLYRYNLAVTLTNLKKRKEALHHYRILIKELPDEAEYYFQAGDLLEQQDSLKSAVLMFNKSIELEPDNFQYFFYRGTNYLKRNQFQLAVEDFNKSAKLNPEHSNSLHNRAIALYKLGRTLEACTDWCDALLLDNPNSASHLQRNCKVIPSKCLLSK